MNDSHTQQAALVEQVFAAPNVLRYTTTNECPPAVEAARRSIRRFLGGRQEWPLLLPVRRAGDVTMCWYMCAHSETQLRALHDEMRAFVGPTYTQFPSMRSPLDQHDPIEHALSLHFGERVLKLPIPEQYEAKVNQQVNQYLSLLSERPSITAQAVASFSQLRSRFDVALLAGNESSAQEYLTALSARDLSAENRHFLKLRFHAALGQWERIAEYPLLSSLLNLKLPPETYSDIFEALYQAKLHPVEETGSLVNLVNAFQEDLFQPYSALFRTRRQSSRPAVLKGFICRELSLPAPDPQRCLALLAQLPVGAFPGAIEAAVRARCASLAKPDPQLAAREALDREDFDRAFELYRTLAPALESLCALLRCAREIGDPGVARSVLAMLEQAPDELRSAAVKRTPRMHELVVALAAQTAPAPAPAPAGGSLVARLDWLKEAGETAQEYVERWREGAASWAPEGLLAEVGCGKTAATIIETLSLVEPEIFEQVFPLWYRLFIERVPAPDTRLVPVYLALMATLRVREVFAEDELTLVKRAAACVLECSVTAPLYDTMVNDLDGILQGVRSVHAVDWALDMADQLLTAACPAPETRVRFLTAAVDLARQFSRRLTSLQRNLVSQIGAEAGFPVELAARMADDSSSARAAPMIGRVAIYTLDPAIATRAKLLLRRSYPELRVDLNSDTVCTGELKQLARNADWFVFAWRCATHQAWFCVKAAAGDSGKLCWASGNGAASLAQAVERQLAAGPDRAEAPPS
jgi:hypothetical protein